MSLRQVMVHYWTQIAAAMQSLVQDLELGLGWWNEEGLDQQFLDSEQKQLQGESEAIHNLWRGQIIKAMVHIVIIYDSWKICIIH